MIIECVRATLISFCVFSLQDTLTPVFLSNLAAPFCIVPSEFPIFFCALLVFVSQLDHPSVTFMAIVGVNLFLNPSSLISVLYHSGTAFCLFFLIKRHSLFCVILTVFGGFSYGIFLLFPHLQMCTSIFLFLMLQIILGSLAMNWLIAPPIQMVH